MEGLEASERTSIKGLRPPGECGGAGGLREDFHQRVEAARGVWRAGGLREDFHQRVEAARGVWRAGGHREDFHQRSEATRYSCTTVCMVASRGVVVQ